MSHTECNIFIKTAVKSCVKMFYPYEMNTSQYQHLVTVYLATLLNYAGCLRSNGSMFVYNNVRVGSVMAYCHFLRPCVEETVTVRQKNGLPNRL